MGKRSKEEELQYLKAQLRKKEEQIKKLKGEEQNLISKIEVIETEEVLAEARKSKFILSNKDISLVEITKALKNGDFKKLEEFHNKLNNKKGDSDEGHNDV